MFRQPSAWRLRHVRPLAVARQPDYGSLNDRHFHCWGGLDRRRTAHQMIDHTPMRGNYTRFDLMVAIGFAALVAVWLLVYAVLLIKFGGHSG